LGQAGGGAPALQAHARSRATAAMRWKGDVRMAPSSPSAAPRQSSRRCSRAGTSIRRRTRRRPRSTVRTSRPCRSRSGSRASSGCGGFGSLKIELNRSSPEFLCALISRRG